MIMKSPALKAIVPVFALLVSAYPATSQSSGLPVIDGANLSQNVVTALENVSQTLKQIQQYKTQLQQYQNMLQNTQTPTTYVWDMASKTMNDLRLALDTLQYYKSRLGSVAAYTAKFKDTAGYRSSPCFTDKGCSADEWAALRYSQDLASESQKKSTDALLQALDKQQDAMQADAMQLQKIQSLAQGANGQMQAMGYANQLASQQATQLLQIRALLIAQQNIIATRYQALADREAQARASDALVLKNIYEPSPPRGW
jgi:P-type conjugative transfer protein TrbJ